MQIGYARSSTVDQEAGFQAQIKSLKAAGCEKVFAEKVSSVAERAQLEAALDYAREGDVLVVTKLDRLAQSVSHLVAIGGRLEAKAVALRVLEQAIDTSNCTGRLMLNMLGAIAQFERELMLERQREGKGRREVPGTRTDGSGKGLRHSTLARRRDWTNRDREAIGDQ
jgi:DNA invertase Pin-like site-specific DNA recombinase